MASQVPAFRARARDTALDLGADILIFALLEPIVWVDDAPEPKPEIITISGGLQPDASGDFATYGDVTVDRKPGESVEDFQRRARGSAQAAGVEWVVFGGLPRMNVSDDECETKGE